MKSHRKWFWIVLVIAVTVAALAVAQRRTRTKLIYISFAGFTNAANADRPLAVFVATNKNSRTLRYLKHVERMSAAGWPVYVGVLPHNDSAYVDVPAGQEFRIHAYPVPGTEGPWRVSIAYSLLDDRWGEVRWRAAEFFFNRNLPAIGELFHEGAVAFIATGPEMDKSAPLRTNRGKTVTDSRQGED